MSELANELSEIYRGKRVSDAVPLLEWSCCDRRRFEAEGLAGYGIVRVDTQFFHLPRRPAGHRLEIYNCGACDGFVVGGGWSYIRPIIRDVAGADTAFRGGAGLLAR